MSKKEIVLAFHGHFKKHQVTVLNNSEAIHGEGVGETEAIARQNAAKKLKEKISEDFGEATHGISTNFHSPGLSEDGLHKTSVSAVPAILIYTK